MLFNTLQFAVFFAVVLCAYRLAPPRARNPILLAASLLFYTLWLPAYLLLLLGDIFVNYALLRAMVRSQRPKLFLTISIVFTLSLLAGFKYSAMLVTTSLPFLEGFFGFEPPIPDVFLPLGISFYSFQLIALSVDTYKGRIAPIHSLSRYTLFISFFPQLVAGPILRGHEFLPQLERGGETNPDRTRRGLWLMTIGLAKKVILADFLLGPFADAAFAQPGIGSTPFHLIAIYSFAFQIYFDFSGYTDMARGMALLLGFELPMNFMEPYLSRSPAELWRRWHITLSRWLSDYLYIPLGGNRRGSIRTAINLLLTMLLGGLWHGASWNFVIWGGLHGLLLVGHRIVGRRAVDLATPISWRDAPRIILMFHAVCLLWIFFRAETLDDALTFLRVLFTGGNPYGWPVLQGLIIVGCIALHICERAMRLRAPDYRERLARASWGPIVEGALIGLLVGTAFMASGVGGEFIYFQF